MRAVQGGGKDVASTSNGELTLTVAAHHKIEVRIWGFFIAAHRGKGVDRRWVG
jgi:hypothetical protein